MRIYDEWSEINIELLKKLLTNVSTIKNKRENVIREEEITNLKIDLGNIKSVDEFIKRYWS